MFIFEVEEMDKSMATFIKKVLADKVLLLAMDDDGNAFYNDVIASSILYEMCEIIKKQHPEATFYIALH